MQNVSYVLNQVVGPFFAGFLLAAFASVSDPPSSLSTSGLQDLRGSGMAECGVRLGEGASVIIAALRLLVVALGGLQQHLRILEERVDQRHLLHVDPLLPFGCVGANLVDHALDIGKVPWALDGRRRAAEPDGEGGGKERHLQGLAALLTGSCFR